MLGKLSSLVEHTSLLEKTEGLQYSQDCLFLKEQKERLPSWTACFPPNDYGRWPNSTLPIWVFGASLEDQQYPDAAEILRQVYLFCSGQGRGDHPESCQVPMQHRCALLPRTDFVL